jgi:hypothetical protein
MAKSLKTSQNRTSLPATLSGPGPGYFAIGSLKSRAAARALLISQTTEQLESEAVELGNLNAFELAVSEGHSGGERLWAIRLARIAEGKSEIFGTSLPTPEKIRRDREVARVADELSGGRLHELSFSNPAEAKRFRDLAEEKLRTELLSPPAEEARRNADCRRKRTRRDGRRKT